MLAFPEGLTLGYGAFSGCTHLDKCCPPGSSVIDSLKSRQTNNPFLWLVCAKPYVTLIDIKVYVDDHKDEATKAEAISNLLPIHVLCLNPTITLEIIQYIISFQPKTVKSQDMNEQMPFTMAFNANLPNSIQVYLFSCHPLRENRYAGLAKGLILSLDTSPPTSFEEFPPERQNGWVEFISSDDILSLDASLEGSCTDLIKNCKLSTA